jgi:hypothetical protein
VIDWSNGVHCKHVWTCGNTYSTFSVATSLHSEVYLICEFSSNTFWPYFTKGHENAMILHTSLLDIKTITQKYWTYRCLEQKLFICMKCLYCPRTIVMLWLGVKNMVSSFIIQAITIWTALMYSAYASLSYIFFTLSLLLLVLYDDLLSYLHIKLLTFLQDGYK